MSAAGPAFRRCNPLYGYRWLVEGVRLFLRQPWPWLALVGMTLLLFLILSLLPLLGVAAIFTIFPCVAAGFLLASRAASQGESVRFTHLSAVCQTGAKPLLTVGAIAFGLFFLVLILLTLGWREQFTALIKLTQSSTGDQAALLRAVNDLTIPTLLALLTVCFIAVLTWFAPGLIAFQHCAARAALMLSLRAWLSNFAPFLVFAVLLLLTDIILSFLLRLLLSAIAAMGGDQVASIVGMALSFPLVCSFLAVLFAAAYLSYIDVFEAQPKPD